MTIVIANGRNSADFLIQKFKAAKHKLIVINQNPDNAKYISERNGIDVYVGNPTRSYVLEDTNVQNANIFIALSHVDTDNYLACMLAKKVFGVDKCICSVDNPKNVAIFKKLGIEYVLSSSHLIGETIDNMISISKLVNSLTFEKSKIVVSEVLLKSNDFVTGKELKELNFANKATVSAVYRRNEVIIPKGDTRLLKGDRVFLISAAKDQKSVLNYINDGKY